MNSHPQPVWNKFDSSNRIPFLSDSRYTRNLYDWWIYNENPLSDLFLDGSYQNSDQINWSLNLPQVWTWQNNATGVRVGLVDIQGTHSAMGMELVRKVAPGAVVTLFPVSRYYANVVGPAIENAVAEGNRIVVLTTGFPTAENEIFHALAAAKEAGVILVCATPDALVDLRTVPDYPSTSGFTNVLPVSAVDMSGQHYWSGYGWQSIIAAPGRNIMAAGVYSSGTSYAAPIVAGVLALLMRRYPGLSPEKYINHLSYTSDSRMSVRRLNAANAILNSPDANPLP